MEISTRIKSAVLLLSLAIHSCNPVYKSTPPYDTKTPTPTPDTIIPVPNPQTYAENATIPTDTPEEQKPQVPQCSTIIIKPSETRENADQFVDAPYAQSIHLNILNGVDLRVAHQLPSNPGFVSPKDGYVTQFIQAQKFGTFVFLAHDYKAGVSFYFLHNGDTFVIKIDGQDVLYKVTDTFCFRTLSPLDPGSQQVQIDNNAQDIGPNVSAESLFRSIFINRNKNGVPAYFMTCIPNPKIPFNKQSDADLSWGRFFVKAEPVEIKNP